MSQVSSIFCNVCLREIILNSATAIFQKSFQNMLVREHVFSFVKSHFNVSAGGMKGDDRFECETTEITRALLVSLRY